MIRRSAFRLTIVSLAAVLLALPASLVAKGGVYSLTKHGDPRTGVSRDARYPRGECAQCHTQHGPRGQRGIALFAPNTNRLCYACHRTGAPGQSYQGPTVYDASSHATRPTMVWPGADPAVDPAAPRTRKSDDWGKCVNCHDPHGYNVDRKGLIPSLAVSREEKLCIVCHDGSPASKNVKLEFTKPYTHPTMTLAGIHAASEGGTAAAYGATPINRRHAECVDCHNPHADLTTTSPPIPPTAPGRLARVGRVAVMNGPPGTVPTYLYRGPGNETQANEYEICFKCHSSWTTQPAGQRDYALRFNPNNASYHPVEARGKNPKISGAAFVNNWTAASLVYCTDCHSSDSTIIRGPHGSRYRHILKADYRESSTPRPMASGELCFECHRYDTYANDGAAGAVKAASRFNPPAAPFGHTYHVQQKQYACGACHNSHASVTAPHLMALGRSPGLTNYAESATGGSCTTVCHAPQAYRVNYPR